MRSRSVSFSETAQSDLLDLEIWLETAAGKKTARKYVDSLIDHCLKLNLASQRGANRDDLFPGLHTIGFRRRVTIAFEVADETVVILRIFRAGRDWEAEFSED